MDEEEYFEYLDALRESGVVNMFGAGAYLQRQFGMDKIEAKRVLLKWMETYSDRHKEDSDDTVCEPVED